MATNTDGFITLPGEEEKVSGTIFIGPRAPARGLTPLRPPLSRGHTDALRGRGGRPKNNK
jgi:hypothetical protein